MASFSELSEARSLAQKLYGQCRDSAGGYKLLTGSIRKLRNVLEEVEELFEDTGLPGSDDRRLCEQTTKSAKTLAQLDLALQYYRCSAERTSDENKVSEIKTSLDTIVDQLSTTLDAIATSDNKIQLLLDPTQQTSTASQTSSGNLPSLSPTTRSDTDSIASPGTQPDAQTTTGFFAPTIADVYEGIELQRLSEKEVVDFNSPDYLQSSTPIPQLNSANSNSWSQPFASPDPLSISIEEATFWILGNDGNGEGMQACPNNISYSSTSDNISAPPTTTMAQEEQEPSQPTGLLGLGITELNPLAETSVRGTTTNLALQSSEEFNAFLSPDTALTRRPTRARSASASAPIGSGLFPSSSRPSSTESSRRATITSNVPSVNVIAPIEDSARNQRNEHGDEVVESHQLTQSRVGHDAETSLNATRLSYQKHDRSASSPDLLSKSLPPTPPGHMNENVRSRRSSSIYRVVNASPSDTADSDDELYTSSLPSSPVKSGITSLCNSGIVPQTSTVTSEAQASSSRNSVSLETGTAVDLELPPLPPRPDDLTHNGPKDGIKRASTMFEFQPFDIQLSSALTGPLGEKVSPPSPTRDSLLPSPPLPPPKLPLEPTDCRDPSSQCTPDTVQEVRTDFISADKPSISRFRTQRRERLDPQQRMRLPRVSADCALKVENKNPQDSYKPQESLQERKSVSIPTADDVYHEPNGSDAASIDHNVKGVFGADGDGFEMERIAQCIHHWRDCAWMEAVEYLNGYHEQLLVHGSHGTARRVRHLMGVCASLHGDFRLAISMFLSVLRTPISHAFALDEGDCAAAYWLGDAYAMLNERTEAMLAYCIAERNPLFQNPAEPDLIECISAEQEAVMLGRPRTEFENRWASEQKRKANTERSILDPEIVTKEGVQALVISTKEHNWLENRGPFNLHEGKSRAMFLESLHKGPPPRGGYGSAQLSLAHFDPNAPWPFPFDPFFAMANVKRGGLLAYECDLLRVYSLEGNVKLSSTGPKGVRRMDCCTSNSLEWLIETIRECLLVYELEWTEVANIAGTWFVVRYPFVEAEIATVHYFSISLFRQSLRSGYGADICPNGIRSARIVNQKLEQRMYDKGVRVGKATEMEEKIRKFINKKAKERPKTKKSISFPTLGNRASTLFQTPRQSHDGGANV